MNLTTHSEWWELLEAHKNNIALIVERFAGVDTETFMKYVDNRDSSITHILSDAWFYAPDHPSLHRISSWGQLCDLCSESYLVKGENDVLP